MISISPFLGARLDTDRTRMQVVHAGERFSGKMWWVGWIFRNHDRAQHRSRAIGMASGNAGIPEIFLENDAGHATKAHVGATPQSGRRKAQRECEAGPSYRSGLFSLAGEIEHLKAPRCRPPQTIARPRSRPLAVEDEHREPLMRGKKIAIEGGRTKNERERCGAIFFGLGDLQKVRCSNSSIARHGCVRGPTDGGCVPRR